MKYYLGYIECKVSYKERMILIWVRQKLGDELFKEINQDYCKIDLEEEKHPHLPDDLFKLVHIYVTVDSNSKHSALFPLKYSTYIEEVINE